MISKYICCILEIVYLLIQIHHVSGDEGVLYSRSKGGNQWTEQYCIFYNPLFHNLTTLESLAEVYKLVDLSSKSGCNRTDYETVDVKGEPVAVIVARGECTFTEKASNAQSVGAKAIVVASDQLITPGAANNTVDYDNVNITVATALWSSVHGIQKKEIQPEIVMFSPEPSDKFDFNLVIIFLIAVTNICIGGCWAGYARHAKYLKLLAKQMHKETNSQETDSDKDDDEEEEESVDITIPAIVVFFVLVCTFIVLLYFFYDQLVYVVIALFCLAGAMGLYHCTQFFWKKVVPFKSRLPVNRVPFFRSRPEYRNIILGLLCIGIGVWWGVERHASYSWILQDILGYMFCLNVMRTVSIPNLKICTIMLTLLFLYDIFFVFVTPSLTSNGDSIMVKVATGGNSKTQETIPMAFRVPKLIRHLCPVSDSLLGFGDIVIPGLLVSHNHTFDLRIGSRKVYFIGAAISYSVGLIITFVALFLMETGQPALLYIVPCTLLTTFVIGLSRGEVKNLWTGIQKVPKSETSVEDDISVTNQSTTSVASAGSSSSDSSASENKELIRRK